MLDPAAHSIEWPGDNERQILSFFKYKESGFFVDIGALNGFDLSNTRALWQLGWCGVMVEPDARSFAQLKANYGDDPRLRLVNAAICAKDGQTVFFESKGPPTFSSMDPRWIKELGPERFEARTVMGLHLGSPTLALPNSFDLLKIDTEGMDSAIIESMPLAMRPTLILAEVNKADGAERISRCLENRGYKLAWKDGLDIAYALP